MRKGASRRERGEGRPRDGIADEKTLREWCCFGAIDASTVGFMRESLRQRRDDGNDNGNDNGNYDDDNDGDTVRRDEGVQRRTGAVQG